LILAYLRVILFLSIVIFLSSCEKDDPTSPKDSPPVLSNLAVPDTILTGIDQSYIFSVKCNDENSLDDIDSVSFKISTNTGQLVVPGMMFDDGNYDAHGDNVPGDGKYSIRLKFDLNTGEYRFAAQAVDLSKLKSSELSDSFYAMPGIINLAPVIAKHHIPDTVYVDEIVPFYLSVKASDPDSQDFISKVTYQILGPKVTELAEEGILNDNGIEGDSLAGDGIYSIETTTSFASWKFGEYHLMIVAFDSHSKSSNTIYEILPWSKKNIGVPPQIYDLAAPDTIKLPSSGVDTRNITIKARDGDHYNDIKHVFFYSIKPDGTLANNGNPLFLYDDGVIDQFKWDEVALDSIFSIQIKFPSDTNPGEYRFEFQAIDYSDLLSNKIVHRVRVIN
jgi:hypothetical protein